MSRIHHFKLPSGPIWSDTYELPAQQQKTITTKEPDRNNQLKNLQGITSQEIILCTQFVVVFFFLPYVSEAYPLRPVDGLKPVCLP